MKMRILVLAAVVAASFAVAACGSDKDASDQGNSNDAAFVHDMTSHHQGAIDMAEIAETKADRAQIKQLAVQIIAAQKGEIAVMRGISNELKAHGVQQGGSMGMSDAAMGMNMKMSEFKAASPFDRAFIDAMIPHHQGAIAMAKQEIAHGSHPQLIKMARDIISAQTREISEMQNWRNSWFGGGAKQTGHMSPGM